MANAPELDLNNWRRPPRPDYVNRAAVRRVRARQHQQGHHRRRRPGGRRGHARHAVHGRRDNIAVRATGCSTTRIRTPRSDLTFAGVVAKSSNVGTDPWPRAKVGSAAAVRDADDFGFGAQPAAACPGERPGLLPDYKNWSGSQSCTIAYGQGVSVERAADGQRLRDHRQRRRAGRAADRRGHRRRLRQVRHPPRRQRRPG